MRRGSGAEARRGSPMGRPRWSCPFHIFIWVVGVRLPRHGSSEMSRAADLGEGEIGIPLKDGLTSPSTLVRLLRRTGIEFELMMIPSSSTTGVVSVPPEILLRRTRIEG